MKISLEGKSPQIADFCQKVSKFLIYFLVFLLPIFFLPFTADPSNFNKQFLIGIFLNFALIFWLIKVFVSGKIELNLNFFNIPVLIFLLIYAISTVFSLCSKGSFFGFPLNTSQGFLTLFYFCLFYFLVSNNFSEEEIFRLLFLFLTSAFFLSISSFFQIFGKINFNPIGSLNSLSIFLSILIPISILLSLFSKKIFRYFFLIFSIFYLISLILINFQFAYLTLIFSTSILFIFGLLNLKKSEKFGLIFISIFILILALFFLVFKIPFPKVQIPIEVSITKEIQFQIAKKSLSNLKNLFFGTGPSTFIFDYSKFKPETINQTPFLDIKFNFGSSEILDKLITTGVLGIFSLFLIFYLSFFRGWKTLISLLEENKDFSIHLSVFSGFFGLIFAQIFYPANFSILFSFWFFLAQISILNSKIKNFPLSFRSIKFATFFTFIFIFSIFLSFLLIKNYIAQINYFQGLKAWQNGNFDLAINSIERAINLNPGLDLYQRDLAQIYLAKLNESLKNQKLEEIQNFSAKALVLTKRATEISPNDVANWIVRGFVCRNLIALVGGTEDCAINSYQKAIELEPKNPYIFNEMGLIYLTKADLLAKQSGKEDEINQNLAKAKDNFQEAIELKPDYAPAHFQLAMISVKEGKTKDAIQKLEETKSIAPLDSGLAFQLGLLYYNDNQFDLAKAEFERAVSINENFSDARYFLGLIYAKEGEKDLAIEQFEKIEILNPDNSEIKKILANLKEGKPALEGISTTQSLIEEKLINELRK